MTQEQVRKKYDKLQDKLSKAEGVINMIHAEFENLERICKHPRAKSYRDISGVSSDFCPDCHRYQ